VEWKRDEVQEEMQRLGRQVEEARESELKASYTIA
jgi:hypothetical protein